MSRKVATPDIDESSAVKRSVRLLRVSSKAQTDTDADFDSDGNSIDTQRKYTIAKEREMGTVNVGEYVEPGYSGQSIEKRPFFKDMMQRIVEERDVDYVVIYMRSRVFRNYKEAALVKLQLEAMGVKIISARENFGDDELGEAMEAITDVFNWLEVRRNGKDISTKMLNKAQNGGIVGKAKVGYLNVTKNIGGHKVNTVEADPDRKHFIPMAFELAASGEYTTESVHEALVDAGLTMPGTGKPVSIQTVQKLLRDPTYIGHVIYKGIEYDNGRHEALISPELFERVQRVLDSHSGAGTRERTHPHYLKGVLWCDRCKHRLIVQRAVGRRGGEYYYFLCRGRQDGVCDQPYVPVEVIEEAVTDHYSAALFLPPEFRAEVREGVLSAVESDFQLTTEMRANFEKRLTALEKKESYFLDLAAEEGWPKDKLRAKLEEIRTERGSIRRQLDVAQRQLETGRTVFLSALELLDDPKGLYERGDEAVRSTLNKAFFSKLYVDGKRVSAHELKEPFDVLQAAYDGYQAYQSKGPRSYARKAAARPYKAADVAAALGGDGARATASRSGGSRAKQRAASNKAAVLTDSGLVSDRETMIAWLSETLEVKGWSKAVVVGLEGLEPPTS